MTEEQKPACTRRFSELGTPHAQNGRAAAKLSDAASSGVGAGFSDAAVSAGAVGLAARRVASAAGCAVECTKVAAVPPAMAPTAASNNLRRIKLSFAIRDSSEWRGPRFQDGNGYGCRVMPMRTRVLSAFWIRWRWRGAQKRAQNFHELSSRNAVKYVPSGQCPTMHLFLDLKKVSACSSHPLEPLGATAHPRVIRRDKVHG